MKRVLAAFMFFTRLPLWRMVEVPSHYFKRVVELWPLTGWLTGGVMALTMWLSAQILPATVAALMAIAARLILTGALHDDGLADFCDGFGGGTSRERILAIMKDSHIGTYGVITLIIYYTLFVTLISSLPLHLACMTLIAGDVWSKFCASQVINLLPYARKEEESKARTIYNRMSPLAWVISLLIALPSLLLLPYTYIISAAAPIIATLLMVLMMRHRIQGYTGDCCGALFLISEMSFYISETIIFGILR